MDDCAFCAFDENIEPERRIYDYDHWRLVLQREKKRSKTKQSAGLLISRRHIAELSSANDDEMIELRDTLKDAVKRLCDAVGVSYAGQETVGFNQGAQAGQTVFHCHIHLLPVAKEDPEELKMRSGIGGAFEALHRERLGK